ncbi:cupin domain-containing protein [Chloroflexota bacterium]
MSLWPGYYQGKNLSEPALTEIPKIKIDPSQEPDKKVETVAGNFYSYRKSNVLRCANGFVCIEDFGAGETITWMFQHDEFHWIAKGKAEMTYSLAGTSHTESKTVTIQEGDIYLLPLGARVTWKVATGSPLRKICVLIPAKAPSTRRPEKITDLK